MHRLLGALCLMSLGLALAGCQQTEGVRHSAANENGPSPSGAVAAPNDPAEPPLLLEEAPLLLGDSVELGQMEEGGADNSRCAVCHVNLIREELAWTHARADVGCADCHGPSDAHIADESWASGGNGTAPDTMFPKETINAACLECHPREKVPADEHEPLFAGTSQEKYCTDCHGNHLLAKRTCKWK